MTAYNEYEWCPKRDDFLSLMWTLFPDEIGDRHPRGNDTLVPDNLPHSVKVNLTDDVLDKLVCFSIVSSLPVHEVIRRLLESEVTLFGRFSEIDIPVN